jgi:PAS domain S-box-containing protein
MRWLLASAEEIVFEGRPALLTSYHDITEQKQAEERFHAIFDQAAVGIGLMTPGGRFLAVNKKLCELMRRDEATLLDLRFNDFTHPDDYEQCTAHMTSLVAGDISTFSSEMRFSPEEDVLLWGTLTVSAIRDQSSDRYALLGIVEDVTERKRAENAQQQSEDRLREAAKLAHLGYWVWDAIEDKCLFCSEECARIHGLTPEEYIDRTAVIDGEFLLVHPDDREEVQEKFRSLRSGQEIEIEYRVLTPEGEPRHVREIAKPVLDENGHVIQEHGTILDITDLRRSEEQLRQAQKMEAVGQLTGGVAHDFNNLLAIIQGNIAFLDRKLAEDDSLKALTAPTLRAVKRGASLTQRLLAFSRQQSLDVQPIDVGQLVTKLGEMLDRSLGEDISMKIHVAPELWMCEVDSGQLEQAIVNLANNARDALVEGGELIIDVSNACLTDERVAEQVGVAAGEYVAISVTDDGPGMPAEVREKIFDPFYTTKEVGKGTGLGLSMVYGFLQQSGGQVIVESEPGQGTTFRLYLPRLILGEIEQDENAGDETVPAASELVLLVEDDEDLRAMTRMLLMDLGYRVIEAGSGSQAHDMLTTIDKVDLLLTDVVLPGGMSGPEFADAALQTNPDLKVAYMSGYMGDALERYGELRDSVLIQKPFDGEGLGRQLRKVLGGD